METIHLNQYELAKRWRMSQRTLERWRWQDIGPAYLKLGMRVFYGLEDVEAFERESILEPGTMLDLSHYRASVTNERGLEMACRGSPTSELIEVATYGWVECTTAGVSYRFNFITDRYLKAQLSGYATPSDNATLDTPHIALGTCQRIE